MPATFTVKAGFNMPTNKQSSPSSPGTLEPVDISYDQEGSERESREFSDYSSIITAQSLDSARQNKILANSNSVSQRHSRTLATNLFGGQQLGDEADRRDDNHKMWMIVITVSAGLVVVSVMAVLVVCRPAAQDHDHEETAGVQDEISVSSQVNVNDTEALQPKSKEKKKVYRPSESRA